MHMMLIMQNSIWNFMCMGIKVDITGPNPNPGHMTKMATIS